MNLKFIKTSFFLVFPFFLKLFLGIRKKKCGKLELSLITDDMSIEENMMEI